MQEWNSTTGLLHFRGKFAILSEGGLSYGAQSSAYRLDWLLNRSYGKPAGRLNSGECKYGMLFRRQPSCGCIFVEMMQASLTCDQKRFRLRARFQTSW